MDTIKSPRVYRFVEEYAKDRNGTQAAIRAGYSPKTAGQQAFELLRNPQVQELIEAKVAKISERVEFEAADVLREWVLLATADPTKIAKVRRVACRYCWGAGHAYAWKPREYAEACDEAMRLKLPMPPCDGGFGYVANREPHHACPECEGEGVEDVFFADMESLAAPERKLIASVKRTKDGLEVKMRDQDAAVQHIAKYLGLLVEKRELTGKGGGPLAVASIPVTLPDDPQALGALYTQLVGGA